MKIISIVETNAYLQEQVDNHSIYVYGGQGQQGDRITERWIRRMEQDTGGTKVGGKYVSYADLAVQFWQRQIKLGYGDVLRAFDCSGLFSFWLMLKGVLDKDRSAHGIHSLCKDTTEKRSGYMVFRENSDGHKTHCGQLVSDNEVIHCRGRQSGCVRELYDPNYWHVISIPPWFKFDEDPPAPPEPSTIEYVHPLGNVRVREGNGTEWKQIYPTATKKDYLPLLGQAEEQPYWYHVEWKGREGYITSKPRYTEVVEK